MKKAYFLLTLLMISLGSIAQSFYNIDNIQNISIVFSQSNWDALLDAEKAGSENYIMAQTIFINGVVFDSVGVKYKGNSTYNANQTKNPLHIELDTYKNQDYEGYSDIKLSNVAKDPSFIREVLGYKILSNYMDAPLSNFVNVYINGTLMGLYVSSESVSKKFVKDRFNSKTNTFIKCNPPAGAGPGSSALPNLVYLGQDSTDYYAKYELNSDYGWNELINLCDTLKNTLAEIHKILDVDRALWMLAFDNVTVNLDSYIGGFAQNYYLYRDDNNRFLPVIWDLNESFGTFSSTGSGSLSNTTAKQQMSHLLHSADATYPLVSQLLSIATYKKMYLAHSKTILEDNFTTNGSYYTEGLALQSTIDAAVQADPNKFYTYANFISNLSTDVTGGGGPGGGSTPGITNLMNGRYNYLMGLSDFSSTEPTISSIIVSDTLPEVGDTISFTTNVINANSVYLGYRYGHYDPFEKVTMYDDGMHNDGAANDNVYGADIVMSSGMLEYYFYAENSTIGKFSPTNAEHVFYHLYARSQSFGELVINEFLASNFSVAVDQDGQYDDWIEIYNKGNMPINLENYRLSDKVDDLSLFTFPAGTIINSNEYIVVWADKDITQSGYHANFKLSASGETIYLADANLAIVDSITYSSQVTDISFGRYPNGTGSFQSMTPTIGTINMLGTGVGDMALEKGSIKVYPNPAGNSFTIELEKSLDEAVEVSVYDLQGSLVYTNSLTLKLQVNSSAWSSGFYFIRVGNTSSKLIID